MNLSSLQQLHAQLEGYAPFALHALGPRSILNATDRKTTGFLSGTVAERSIIREHYPMVGMI